MTIIWKDRSDHMKAMGPRSRGQWQEPHGSDNDYEGYK